MPRVMVLVTPLRAARQAKGLSQIALAERANVSIRSISMYEMGKATPKNPSQLRLLKALGRTWADRPEIWPECVGRGVGVAARQSARRIERRRLEG